MAVASVLAFSCTPQKEESTETSEEVTMEKSDKGMLRHVVMFKFKDETAQEDVDKVVNAFLDLKNSIPEIKSIEWGTNNSPEGLNQGLTHCFTLTFDNAADRDAYLPNPNHKEFGKILGPHLDKVTVIDYTIE